MIFLSLSCRVITSTSKKLTIRRLLDIYKADVIFFQETMCLGIKAIEELKILIKYWEFVSIDALGKSSALLTRWNCRTLKLLNSWSIFSSIGVILAN